MDDLKLETSSVVPELAYKGTVLGGRQIVQRLRALAAVEEDLDSIPSTHVVGHNSGSGDRSQDIHGQQAHKWCAYILTKH